MIVGNLNESYSGRCLGCDSGGRTSGCCRILACGVTPCFGLLLWLVLRLLVG